MKPDRVTMKPPDTDAGAKPPQAASTQEDVIEPATVSPAVPESDFKPVAANFKPKPKGSATPVRPGTTGEASGASVANSRPCSTPTRAVNRVNPQTGWQMVVHQPAEATVTAAVSKKTVGPPKNSARAQTKVADMRSVGPARKTSTAAALTNSNKPATVSCTSVPKRPPAGTVNGARPKTTASTNRPATSSKTGTGKAAVSKTTRPATGPFTSHPASSTTTTKPTNTATSNPSTAGTTRPAASRFTITHSHTTGRATTTQPPKNAAAARKDVNRHASAAVANSNTALAATKKMEPSKPAATLKPESASRGAASSKTTDIKQKRPKPQEPSKPTQKAAPSTSRLPTNNKPPLGRVPPANRTSKRGTKPTQAVPPFTAGKNTGDTNSGPAAEASTATAVTATAIAEATVSIAWTMEVPSQVATVPEPAPSPAMAEEPAAQSFLPKMTDPSTSKTPVRMPSLNQGLVERSHVSSVHQTAQDEAPPTLTATPPSHSNIDEEEREGSQQVSVSEMSGTTQPTEESHPGSAGLASGSAWRAGGALVSELDSEEVSGSQQGVSELSAPGVLEGTESMDDLGGDASLKGAIYMEGASVGSPDFEKVPDIPANEEDEDDWVCDMDVGSELVDTPQIPRHNNDVEMASEAVTESGLESYGNADEDDLAEYERLDNLNQVSQPPVLPFGQDAEWCRPSPIFDPWVQPSQPLEQVPPPLNASSVVQPPTSPSTDPWQADSETPLQSQARLEIGSAPFPPQEASHQSALDVSPKPDQSYMDQPCLAPVQTFTQARSLSSTMSSEISTPEELHIQAASAPLLSAHPSSGDQDPGVLLRRAGVPEKKAETLLADEAVDGPETIHASDPSSSSTAEDEASYMEGEAQLDNLPGGRGIDNVAFDSRPRAQRCLSALEEGEEAELKVEGGDAILVSANSAASYGFDNASTASSSNAQSTWSPGIFPLEEDLPEEAKDPCVFHEAPSQTCQAEQHYMQCGMQEGVEVCGSVKVPDPVASTPTSMQPPEEHGDDNQPRYCSAICEKTKKSFAGPRPVPPVYRPLDHPRVPCDIIKPPSDVFKPCHDTVTPCSSVAPPPRLSFTDLLPRGPSLQVLSPQLSRLEQHHRQLQELQQRREQQEEAEDERKRRGEEEEEEQQEEQQEEQWKKRVETEEELKNNKVGERGRREKVEEVEQQQQEVRRKEDRQRQQILRWQQELEEQQAGLLSPSSGLCTIYEALETSEDEEEEDPCYTRPLKINEEKTSRMVSNSMDRDSTSFSSTRSPRLPLFPHNTCSDPGASSSLQDVDSHPLCLCLPPHDLTWGRKVDMVQQLIHQTLLLTGDGCSPLLLLPGGGGTLSPLESSLWPSLLPPLTPPSATVTSVSSFSPEATGSSPQGEWTVVELETHH